MRDDGALTTQAKQCGQCGYLHPIPDGAGPDLCERCGQAAVALLLRSSACRTSPPSGGTRSTPTRRSGCGWATRSTPASASPTTGASPSRRNAQSLLGEESVATLTYGQAATLWRINLGWARRRSKSDQHGFVLDIERGYWARNEQIEDDPDDPLSARTSARHPLRRGPPQLPAARARRDARRRIDGLAPSRPQERDPGAVPARRQRAGGRAAPRAATPPNLADLRVGRGRRGRAPAACSTTRMRSREVAREALEICHFDPDTGEDRRHAPRASEDCEAACYDCLMSYGNQPDHRLLDRQKIQDILLRLAQARAEAAPGGQTRAEHLDAGGWPARTWSMLARLPGGPGPPAAQRRPEADRGLPTRPDFFYADHLTAVYIDGPPHDYPDRQGGRRPDRAHGRPGYTVIRFHHQDDWDARSPATRTSSGGSHELRGRLARAGAGPGMGRAARVAGPPGRRPPAGGRRGGGGGHLPIRTDFNRCIPEVRGS